MPAHPTRRGLLALLTLLFIIAAVAAPALARIRYTIGDELEGDPGDGVLKPAKPAATLSLLEDQCVVGGESAGVTWRLPVFVLPSGVSGLPVVGALPGSGWDLFASPWLRPQGGSSVGRWHDAR